MCKQSSQWFVAVRANDLEQVSKLLKRNANSTDRRESSPENLIFKGFGAIHYACLHGHLDIVQLLIKYELGLRTKQTVTFFAPGFSNNTKYKLGENSSCLDIALLQKQPEIIKTLMDSVHNEQNFDLLFGQTNTFNLPTIVTAGLCQYQAAYDVMNNMKVIQAELGLLTAGDVTLATNSAFFGRIECAKMLQRCAMDQNLRYYVFEMMLRKDASKRTVLEISKLEVDLVRYNTTQNEREEVQKIMEELTREAYTYALGKQDEKWENILAEYNSQNQDTVEIIPAVPEMVVV
ncbi:Conserved_hypothetical protein [Hexamita inflata]|uniref:Uncharacterized protein n=1 Tax=Hexamita inflata TaxID=28002 RepID=A0ABP1J533_9EUKA